MGIIVECQIIREVYKKDNFFILAAIPIGDMGSVELNSYGNFTIVGDIPYLIVGKTYTVVLEGKNSQRGMQYSVVSVPSIDVISVDNITEKMTEEVLLEITTKNQTDNIIAAYPNFVKDIMLGVDIDTSKIKNVGKARLKTYIREINNKLKYFHIISEFKEYKLNIADAQAVCKAFPNIIDAVAELKNNPYKCLIELCGRGFVTVDKTLLFAKPDLAESIQRIAYMIKHFIKQEEYDGSTYITTIKLVEYINNYDSNAIQYLKDAVIETPSLHLDAEKGLIQLTGTYLQEKRISDFLLDMQSKTEKLDLDWEKYKNIKDGVLTAEQQNVLKSFCDNSVLILDAPSGTGKTSTLKALLDMCDANNITYKCLTLTGRASSVLAEQTGKEASTIHRASCGAPSMVDLIVVDEVSMVGVEHFDMIIGMAYKENTRILLVGDTAQIPSISKGRVAKDILESEVLPKCTLTKCFRFDEGGASFVSALTRCGDFYLTPEQANKNKLTIGSKKDYTFIKADGSLEQIVDTYCKMLDDGYAIDDVCVLIPYNVGRLGTYILNNSIQDRVNPVRKNEKFFSIKKDNTEIKFHKGDLVMNTKNNYSVVTKEQYDTMFVDKDVVKEDLEPQAVFNGQVGKVVHVGRDVIEIDIDGTVFVFDKLEAYNLLLAYASNPYKYQGSQNKCIINVVVSSHERSWNRQLLYTAQTRMQDKIIEIGDIQTMKYSVIKHGDTHRNTRLKEFLIEGKYEVGGEDIEK